LRCGVSFEQVVEYEFTRKENGPKMKKLAVVGSVVAKWAIKFGAGANPVGKVARLFGVPLPEVPVDTITCTKAFLDDIASEADTQAEGDALKKQPEDGLDSKAMAEFGETVQKLIDDGWGPNWKGKLLPWSDPNSPGMVTFIDAAQYPKHVWTTENTSSGAAVGE
jgi:hypothetical protein